MPSQSPAIPSSSYSTIFHCDEQAAICILRGVEGIISIGVFGLFLVGYRKMMKEQNNPISKQDKSIYMLAMWQTLFLALYYFFFEEFVILATIRNFLIWIAINILHTMCKIFWIKQDQTLKNIGRVITVLKCINVLWWFVFSLGEGSAVVNNQFNLGYNCRLIGWTLLSGFLLIVVTLQGYVGLNIYEKLEWEKKNTDPTNKRHIQSIQNQSFVVSTLISSNFIGALVMFLWDFYAYYSSQNDKDCTDIFAGNTFFRQVLCFVLKLISMQLTPIVIYYNIYERRKDQFFQNFINQNEQNFRASLLNDNASEFNRTIASRVESRKSLFSEVNPHGGSQYL